VAGYRNTQKKKIKGFTVVRDSSETTKPSKLCFHRRLGDRVLSDLADVDEDPRAPEKRLDDDFLGTVVDRREIAHGYESRTGLTRKSRHADYVGAAAAIAAPKKVLAPQPYPEAVLAKLHAADR
jgi:hypothetical protein